jgi:hypothetical protein
LLGLFLFDERIRTGALDLFLEALALAVALIVAGAMALSHSHLIAGEDQPPSSGAVIRMARLSPPHRRTRG